MHLHLVRSKPVATLSENCTEMCAKNSIVRQRHTDDWVMCCARSCQLRQNQRNAMRIWISAMSNALNSISMGTQLWCTAAIHSLPKSHRTANVNANAIQQVAAKVYSSLPNADYRSRNSNPLTNTASLARGLWYMSLESQPLLSYPRTELCQINKLSQTLSKQTATTLHWLQLNATASATPHSSVFNVVLSDVHLNLIETIALDLPERQPIMASNASVCYA